MIDYGSRYVPEHLRISDKPFTMSGGHKTGDKRSRPVERYKDGVLVDRFESITDVVQTVGVAYETVNNYISQGNKGIAIGGYIWKRAKKESTSQKKK